MDHNEINALRTKGVIGIAIAGWAASLSLAALIPAKGTQAFHAAVSRKHRFHRCVIGIVLVAYLDYHGIGKKR